MWGMLVSRWSYLSSIRSQHSFSELEHRGARYDAAEMMLQAPRFFQRQERGDPKFTYMGEVNTGRFPCHLGFSGRGFGLVCGIEM